MSFYPNESMLTSIIGSVLTSPLKESYGPFYAFAESSNISANVSEADSVTVVPLGPTTTAHHSEHPAAQNGSSAEHAEHEEGEEHHPYVILFLMVSFATGVLVRGIIKKLTWFKLPYTVVLLMLGALFGLVSARIPALQLYTALGRENPHVILHTFLPVLIFESAFAMETHTFLRSSFSILVLAIPGMCIAAAMTAVLATFLFDYYWNFKEGLLFGAVTAATDPVAVVSLLREVGASKPLSMLIEGESLMNDGSAIVLFLIMLDICKGTAEVAVGPILARFCQIAIGGPIFGIACGHFFVFWLSRIFNDAVSEITLTIVAAYFTFYVGEVLLEVSGVMAVVCLGVVINSKKTSISPEVEPSLHMFWEMLAYLANTVIFILVGIVITEQAAVVFTNKDLLDIFVLYIGANFIRGAMVMMFFPLLSRIGYGLSWQSALVIIWGGLRGAVGLSLALIIYQDPLLGSGVTRNVTIIGPDGNDVVVHKVVGEKFLIHTASLVFFTLFINGTTTAPLLRILGMSDISAAAKMNMAHAIAQLRETRNKTISMLKMDRFLADANWDMVEKYTFIINPYHKKDTDDKKLMIDEFLYPSMRYSNCPECNSRVFNEPTPKEHFEMANDARVRYLKTEKISYWRQFEHGMISAEAVRTLVGSTEVAADMEGAFLSIDELRKSWEVRGAFAWMRQRLETVARSTELDEEEGDLPQASWRQAIYRKVVNTTWFEVLVYTVILLNMVLMILELTMFDKMAKEDDPEHQARIHSMEPDHKNSSHRKLELLRFSVNIFFFLFYVAEAVLKIIGLGFCNYWSTHWNKLDFAVVLLSMGDITFEVCSLIIREGIDEKFKIISPAILRNIRFLRLFRFTRVLRLIKPMVPRILDFLNRQINQRLSLGYDIGKGYVVGEEEVAKYINHMVDHKQILESLKRLSDESRLMVIRDLGMLQREHPGIAIAVKTRQAVRSVLNNVRETITELKEGGLLDEAEYSRLEHIIDDRVKLLMVAPPYLPPLPPTELLKNIHWVGKNQLLVDHLESHAQLVNLDFGDKVKDYGDAPNGIYIIVSGMLRVECREPAKLHEEILKTGVLPNSEILAPSYEVSVLRDYVGAGNVIGEVGVLTGRHRDASVECETAVQAYYISNEVMAEMRSKFGEGPENLEYMMWRSIAMRVAINVLMDQSQYQSWTQQRIKIYVEKCFLPKLDYKKTFTAVDYLEDVILVQGKAMNPHTREVFTAPTYVPRTVHQLAFLTERRSSTSGSAVLPRLLVIPGADMPQTDIWEMMGYDADAIATKTVSSVASCNIHTKSSRGLLASRPSLSGANRASPSMPRVDE
ncbi:sodium/hydrogen exchanger 10-like isoform X2 [Amphibalanus amphitrite]|uniref:sodium/hydrogen exchanger 10-like isoform X2 n=1 Tax=Amphibalanus amphitrite TaxID=1232801 RepID=UPI001C903F45|nr:sodium/hydrogen exchanger 10-like isoform X2 [Amphibalanus amphitrite]